jgi:hypoxanthine phosphoribosyltransferase
MSIKRTAKKPARLVETWESMDRKTYELADLIAEWCKEDGLRFDNMVIIPKGGYHLGSLLPEMLGFRNNQLLHTSIQTYIEGTQRRSGEYELGQMPTKQELGGKDLLLVDDVWDSGKTLQFIKKYLLDHGAKSVKIAVVYYKPTKSLVEGKPDFFVAETDKWVAHPWENARDNGPKHDIVKK